MQKYCANIEDNRISIFLNLAIKDSINRRAPCIMDIKHCHIAIKEGSDKMRIYVFSRLSKTENLLKFHFLKS